MYYPLLTSAPWGVVVIYSLIILMIRATANTTAQVMSPYIANVSIVFISLSPVPIATRCAIFGAGERDGFSW